MSNKTLKYIKLSKNAYSPSRGSEFAAGFDLHSAYDYIVPSHGTILVLTDLQVSVPPGTYGRLASRSGISLKNGIAVGGGVIDPDYRGNVGIILHNLGSEVFKIDAGDRIAQLICEKISRPCLEEAQCLEETSRGSSGFGSSGTK